MRNREVYFAQLHLANDWWNQGNELRQSDAGSGTLILCYRTSRSEGPLASVQMRKGWLPRSDSPEVTQ